MTSLLEAYAFRLLTQMSDLSGDEEMMEEARVFSEEIRAES